MMHFCFHFMPGDQGQRGPSGAAILDSTLSVVIVKRFPNPTFCNGHHSGAPLALVVGTRAREAAPSHKADCGTPSEVFAAFNPRPPSDRETSVSTERLSITPRHDEPKSCPAVIEIAIFNTTSSGWRIVYGPLIHEPSLRGDTLIED